MLPSLLAKKKREDWVYNKCSPKRLVEFSSIDYLFLLFFLGNVYDDLSKEKSHSKSNFDCLHSFNILFVSFLFHRILPIYFNTYMHMPTQPAQCTSHFTLFLQNTLSKHQNIVHFSFFFLFFYKTNKQKQSPNCLKLSKPNKITLLLITIKIAHTSSSAN